MLTAPHPIGMYVHIPFCRTKCTYCDFTAYAGLRHRSRDYLAALEREATVRLEEIDRPVATLFFGGGTPSELEPDDLRRCLAFTVRAAPLLPHAVIELETNPETVEPERLGILRDAGVTRLSIGVQSFDDAELQAIARFHGSAGALHAVALAHAAGFSSISLDLMLGIPGQTIESWRRSLMQAVTLAPEHISCYGLTLEPSTPMAHQLRRGAVVLPDDDLQAGMYATACDVLAAAGYRHYEVSNWARAGHESAHNLGYWHGRGYLGLGAGAASTIGDRRWSNQRALERYIHDAGAMGHAVASEEWLTADEQRLEHVMLGLRLATGVSAGHFEQRHGLTLREWGGAALERLLAVDLLRWHDGALLVPEDHWFVLHGIISELVTG